MPPTLSPEREAAVVAAYTASDRATFKSIAPRFGVSGTRIEQIIRAYEERTGETVPRSFERRRAARAARSKPSPPSIAQRFAARVRVAPRTECWDWFGAFCPATRGGRPYPRFHALGEQLAHRVSFRLWCGPIPAGEVVTQTCGNDRCVNPFHLASIGLAAARRIAQGVRGGPSRPRRTHCRKGHEFTPANTTWNTAWTVRRGERVNIPTRLCKTCLNARHGSYPRRAKRAPPAGKPPLPADLHEQDVERIVRRATRADRRHALSCLERDLEPWVLGNEIPIPVRRNEPFPEYRARGGSDSWWLYTWWLAGRVLTDDRIEELMRSLSKSESQNEQGGREHR